MLSFWLKGHTGGPFLTQTHVATSDGVLVVTYRLLCFIFGRMHNLRLIALVATMLVPVGLLHAWVLAECGIAITDVLFLIEMGRTRNSDWLKQSWLITALCWWIWVTICSTPLLFSPTAGWLMGFAEAASIIRLIVFAAALQTWLLTSREAQRFAWAMLALSVSWIALESWQQYLTGDNMFGDHRWRDGALTGPFYKPRAGDLFAHLLFIAVLPAATWFTARSGRVRLAFGAGILILGVVTSILIGQRMGTLFTAIGLATSAFFIPNLRKSAVAITVIAIVVVLLTPIISPATHAKLIGETTRNLLNFSHSSYGELYTRATVMGLASPVHGWGYRGFRTFCPLPIFGNGLPAFGIGPTSLLLNACNLHPHNFYLQAFVEAGFPGLVSFIVMMLTWLFSLSRGLLQNPEPLRVGLVASLLTFVWPLASTDEFPTLYMCGWLFFIVGFGLAATPTAARVADKAAPLAEACQRGRLSSQFSSRAAVSRDRA